MNRLVEHVPAFVEGTTPRVAEFETVADLRAVPWVADVLGACVDPVLCKSRSGRRWLLMVDDDRFPEPFWWVIGTIEHGDAVDLPVWSSDTRRSLHERRR